jgi:hypothetical protein
MRAAAGLHSDQTGWRLLEEPQHFGSPELAVEDPDAIGVGGMNLENLEPAGKTEFHDANFTVRGAQSVTPVEIGFRDLVILCLAENDRRFAGYDRRLVPPTAIPSLFRFVLAISKLWTRPKH